MHSLLRAFVVLVALLCGAPACGAIVVRDDAGLEVSIDAPARRIVSLAPHITELLFEIGAGDRLVGATEYSDFPDAAQRIPRVGGLGGIDIEGIVALKPDLVIAWLSGTSQVQLDIFKRLHIPVYRSEPHVLDDVATTLTRFGTLTGRSDAAREAAARFTSGVDGLRATYGTRAPVRVFYQVWNKPLMTVGGPQLTTQVIELCGGRNVFAALASLAPQVDVEAVIAADPQIIVTTSTRTDHGVDIGQWSGWTGVSAVRDRRYLFLDPVLISRHTSRILIGAGQLCRAVDAVRSAARP